VTAKLPERGRFLLRAALFLAGQGLEQLVKACIWHNGGEPPTKGRAGHEIKPLWDRQECANLRQIVIANAQIAADEARASNELLGVPSREHIPAIAEEDIAALAELHGRAGYPLRYFDDADTKGAIPYLLTRALWLTAYDFVKRPNEFLIRCSVGSGHVRGCLKVRLVYQFTSRNAVAGSTPASFAAATASMI
jgi:hypothetical protein